MKPQTQPPDAQGRMETTFIYINVKATGTVMMPSTSLAHHQPAMDCVSRNTDLLTRARMDGATMMAIAKVATAK